MHDSFRRFSQSIAQASGHAYAFVIALLVIAVWLVSGPFFGFSDTWQLVINTGTTIVTFLMVFLLQNTQNRDNEALQLKLDELLRSMKKARNSFIDVEDLPDATLDAFAKEFRAMHERAQHELEARGQRKGTA